MTQPLSHFTHEDEKTNIERLLGKFSWKDGQSERIQSLAVSLIERTRRAPKKSGELETFMKDYALDTEEGLALMCLAEALLRIPDAATRNDLIRDKVRAANWLKTVGNSKDWVVKAAGAGMLMSAKTLDSAVGRIAEPIVRGSMVRAMGFLGGGFVLGSDIQEAYSNSETYRLQGYRMSYDMLGEGARTAIKAEEYYQAYHDAITTIGQQAQQEETMQRPGISIKLSALHPRYEYVKEEECIPEIQDKLKKLALHAASMNVGMTIDAEEVERLDLSLKIIQPVFEEKMFDGWDDFGLAVQAYQKRAYPLIEHLIDKSKAYGRRIHIRLVKGAYWDREIKHAQLLGLSDYPVYTRKMNTDLSYLACTSLMMDNRDTISPMLATHNAHTIASVIDMAAERQCDFELQRLHGMGETLYNQLLIQHPDIKTSIYAPVGNYADLLPYLVRRLLENGANSSFINQLLDDSVPPETLAADPVKDVQTHSTKRHGKIFPPKDMYAPDRLNSKGFDLDDEGTVRALMEDFDPHRKNTYKAAPLINGKTETHCEPLTIENPATRNKLGIVSYADQRLIDKAFETCEQGFQEWSKTPSTERAKILERIADSLELHKTELLLLCIREGGKTIEDARDELRESVDFCRYYAAQGRSLFDEKIVLPGPTGERNTYALKGRGTFVCISPWNFPMAIFTGQVVAALMAGNAVIAKPAEQTPLIAARVVQLMHQAGIPKDALCLLPGDGAVGAQIIAHEKVAGVTFTGSTGAAKSIQRALADKNGSIVPLIAETGGQNAMIVDSSALLEQVTDDVIRSAFGSAGQRCSALRVLYVQDDVADALIDMISGAMKELVLGDPKYISTDIGPVIDEEARAALEVHKAHLQGFAKKLAEVEIDPILNESGYYVAPALYEIRSILDLTEERFGPTLHLVRYSKNKLDDVLDDIKSCGFGLTLGIHSRIDSFHEKIISAMPIGNIYVNRSMTGAVVGSQPFGGQGLSGTGPKAGGPHYLKAFATEQVVSTDTTAAGGNTTLVSLSE